MVVKVVYGDSHGDLEQKLNERYPNARLVSVNRVVNCGIDRVYEAWIQMEEG